MGERVVDGPHQIVDPQLLQLQNDGAQIGPKDLGVGLLLQVLLEARLGVQAEALPRLCTPCSPRSLMRRGL